MKDGEGGLAAAPATNDPAATIALDLLVAVARYLLVNPDATASEVAREVRGRRSDVLRLVRLVRASGVLGYPPDDSRGAGTGTRRGTRCPSCGAGLVVEVKRP